MQAMSTRQIIVADGDLSRLGWLVKGLRDAGHAVFPVSDGDGILRIAHMLSHVDLLIATRDTPTLTEESLQEFIQNRLANVSVVYWDPNQGPNLGELEQLLSL